MRSGPTLVLPAHLHRQLKTHLIARDGREAAAVMICSRVTHGRIKLMVQQILLVPHADSHRERDFLSWPSSYVERALELADADDLSIVLIHSHPGGLFGFSRQDNRSDSEIIPAMHLDRASHHMGTLYHGSAVMVPGGAIKARLYDGDAKKIDIELVSVYGDELQFFWGDQNGEIEPGRRPLAFTKAMTSELAKLSVCVVGVSGTGSIVTEELARMGVGELMLIDFDRIEDKNLNRILNSTCADAADGRLKVDVLGDAIASYRPGTVVHRIAAGIHERGSVTAAAAADILFCCVDSEKGRLVCDRLASACLMPLFDVGVTIPVRELPDGTQAILDVLGRTDYVQPGGTTLWDRGVYTSQSLRAEALREADPAAYAKEVANNYLPGSQEEAPAVLPVNMRAASAIV
ncbi:MAG: ThiF family adenylyltransferase, partial [Pseudomonadales bacterium]